MPSFPLTLDDIIAINIKIRQKELTKLKCININFKYIMTN